MRIRCPLHSRFHSHVLLLLLSPALVHTTTRNRCFGCPGFFRSYFIYSYYYYYYYYYFFRHVKEFLYIAGGTYHRILPRVCLRARPCSSTCKRDRGQVYMCERARVCVCVLRLSFDCVRFAGAIRRHSHTHARTRSHTHARATHTCTHTTLSHWYWFDTDDERALHTHSDLVRCRVRTFQRAFITHTLLHSHTHTPLSLPYPRALPRHSRRRSSTASRSFFIFFRHTLKKK